MMGFEVKETWVPTLVKVQARLRRVGSKCLTHGKWPRKGYKKVFMQKEKGWG